MSDGRPAVARSVQLLDSLRTSGGETPFYYHLEK